LNQTFKKTERLCSKILIDKLFKYGRSFTLFPFRIVWLEVKLDSSSPAQVVFSVPKRAFKRAVDRNKLKRRAREAYRKRKFQLYEFLKLHNKTIALTIVYSAKEKMEYTLMENKINQVIERLINELGNELAE